MSTLTIELPDEVAARLEAVSKETQRTPAHVAAELVEKSLPRSPARLDNSAAKPSPEDLFKWCGVGASGIADLAIHPRHMEKFGED